MRLVLAAVTMMAGWAFADDSDLGAKLPDNSRKVAEHRFRSPLDFEGTMKFYKGVYSASQYPRRAIVNQPNIKAVHVPNTTGKGSWEGINIYAANDEVRIYVVPAEGSVVRKSK